MSYFILLNVKPEIINASGFVSSTFIIMCLLLN